MNAHLSITHRLFATLGAIALTFSLMVGSFSADPQVQHIAGAIA